jgi:hypothetical protein
MNLANLQMPTPYVLYIQGKGRPEEIQFRPEDNADNCPAFKLFFEGKLHGKLFREYSPYFNQDLRLNESEALIEFESILAKSSLEMD